MRRFLVLAAMTVLTLQAGAVLAQKGWYVGGGLGNAERRRPQIENAESLALFRVDIRVEDGSDTGGKIFGGYRLGRHLALEGAYVDLGSTEVSVSFDLPGFLPGLPFELPIPVEFPDLAFTATTRLDTNGWSAQALGLLPLPPRVELFAKAGVLYWKVDPASVNIPRIDDLIVNLDVNADADTGTSAVVGIGLEVQLAGAFALRAEAERFADVGGSDIDLLSAGLAWRF